MMLCAKAEAGKAPVDVREPRQQVPEASNHPEVSDLK
jgi:hypothetical protein